MPICFYGLDFCLFCVDADGNGGVVPFVIVILAMPIWSSPVVVRHTVAVSRHNMDVFNELPALAYIAHNALPLFVYLLRCLCFHRLSVVPWGGLNIVGCYSLDCLNVPGCLLVANAKMLFCATSVVFTLTPFADVHALSVKSVNTAE